MSFHVEAVAAEAAARNSCIKSSSSAVLDSIPGPDVEQTIPDPKTVVCVCVCLCLCVCVLI